ncbi:MAG: hypothetical protein M1812_005507 [Candelaria pacifica]|nr:MAG: hypothetical protein M1812_005507 [Candelaria pacifica]
MGDYMIPFFSALGSNVTFQGVAYRALWEDALAGGNEAGNIMMAQLVEMAAKKCAHGSKIVMSGFSQGAFIVHGAAKLLSAVATAKVSSVIIFGDTLPGQPVGNIPSDKVE